MKNITLFLFTHNKYFFPILGLFLSSCSNIEDPFIEAKAVIPKTVVYKTFSGADHQGNQKKGVLVMDVYPEPTEQTTSTLDDPKTQSRLLKDILHIDKEVDPKKLIPILIVHGGAWNMASTLSPIFNNWLTLIKTKQFRIFSAEHRVVSCNFGETTLALPSNTCWPYPHPVNDIRDAVRYIKKNAHVYNIDPSKVVLIGDSAGGHLVTLNAVRQSGPNKDPVPVCTQFLPTENVAIPIEEVDGKNIETCPMLDGQNVTSNVDASVSAAADFYGPVDFEDCINVFKLEDLIARLFGTSGSTLKKVIAAGSDLSGLSAEEKKIAADYHNANVVDNLHNKMPPIFLAYTAYDTVVPLSNQTRFLEKVKNLGLNPFTYKPGGDLGDFTGILGPLLNVDLSPFYLPHAFMFGIAASGIKHYERAIGELDPLRKLPQNTKDVKKIFGLEKKKSKIEKIENDIIKQFDVKSELYKLDMRLRKWICDVHNTKCSFVLKYM